MYHSGTEKCYLCHKHYRSVISYLDSKIFCRWQEVVLVHWLGRSFVLIFKVEDSYITSKDPNALIEIFMSNTENQYLMTWFSYGTVLQQEQDISVLCPGLAVVLFGEILWVFPYMVLLQRSIRISLQFW